MTEQNIAACLVLSAIGGMMGVLATAILAYPDSQKAKGSPWSPCAQHGALLLSLIFQLGIAISTIAATWYGPVSIVVPTSSSAQLLFNMFMFGVFLGLESFTKSMRVGAYVVVLAAILLPVVGPGVQEDQDIIVLLQQMGAIVWSSILLVSLVISTVGLVVANIRRKRDVTSTAQAYNMFVFNLVAQTSGAVVGTTVAKMFVLVQGTALGVCVAIWLVSSIILVYATILQATTVSQGKFVPLSVGTKIAVNAITGIIIWQDWKVMNSWIGYACVMLYLLLGNYLLSSVDLFGVQNKQYGTAATLEKMQSLVFDPKLIKSDSDIVDNTNDVEMQQLQQQEQAKKEQGDAVSLRALKSASTSEAADWIPDETESGSVGVLSSSTAEADDYMENEFATESSDKHVAKKSGEANTSATTSHSDESARDEPKTVSGVWRKAYDINKKKQHHESKEDAVDVDYDPKTQSGVWRKAYQVKK